MPPTGEFVYDSSVVLSYIFDNPRYRHRLGKLQRDVARSKIPMAVTQSIVAECERRILTVVKDVRVTISELYYYKRGLRNPSTPDEQVVIGNEAYLQIQDFFLNKNLVFPQGSTVREKLEYIETLVIERLESKLRVQPDITLDLFITSCLTEVGKMKANMDNEMLRYKNSIIQVTGNQSAVSTIQSKLSPPPNNTDCLIVTEVQALRTGGKNFVLVVLDYKELIRNSAQIATLTGVPVSDPLYAIHRF